MVDLQQVYKVDYSVVIPVYNGSKSIQELSDRLIAFFKSTSYSFELIFVDDKSLDNSWEIISEIKKQNISIVTGVRLSRNFGQHIATCSGFKNTNGEFVITIDDDLEVNPNDILLLIENQIKTHADVVYGVFDNAKRNFFRKLLKAFYLTFARLVEGSSSSKGSSFRLISSNLAKKIEANATKFIFLDEVFLWYTDKISYVNVNHNLSKRGYSNYSNWNLIKLSKDLMVYSSSFPLKMVKYIGFIFSSINFLIATYYLYRKFIDGIDIPGYASIVISILFSTGLIIFILGVIGEYLSKMFSLLNNPPLYHVDETL